MWIRIGAITERLGECGGLSDELTVALYKELCVELRLEVSVVAGLSQPALSL